jgi:hypothetical protein
MMMSAVTSSQFMFTFSHGITQDDWTDFYEMLYGCDVIGASYIFISFSGLCRCDGLSSL